MLLIFCIKREILFLDSYLLAMLLQFCMCGLMDMLYMNKATE